MRAPGRVSPPPTALAAAVPASWGAAWAVRRVLRGGPRFAELWLLLAGQLSCHLVFCLVDGHGGFGVLMVAGHGLAALSATVMVARLQHAADGLHRAIDRIAVCLVSVARWALGAPRPTGAAGRATTPVVAPRSRPPCGRVAARAIRRRGPPAGPPDRACPALTPARLSHTFLEDFCMRSFRRAVVCAVGAAVAVVLLASAASAHVVVTPSSAPAGSSQELTFRVPNEQDNATTVKLTVAFPDDPPIPSVAVRPRRRLDGAGRDQEAGAADQDR